MEREWELFLAPYEQAVSELKVKLRGIRKQFREQDKHIPIEFVTGRVKPVDSILTKTAIRHIPLNRIEEEMQDIAGLWKNVTTLKIKKKVAIVRTMWWWNILYN